MLGKLIKEDDNWYVRPEEFVFNRFPLHPHDVFSFNLGYLLYPKASGLTVNYERAYVKKSDKEYIIYAKLI